MEKVEVICEMEVTIKMIGGKYKPLILDFLINNGTKRYSEIKQIMPKVSQRTLTNQLRELEDDGLIGRKIYAEMPPKVEYYITEKGLTLKDILELMCQWGMDNMGDKYILTHPQCSI